MGVEFCFRCPNCGYYFSASLGIGGYIFPRFYSKVIEEMKKGKYGKTAQRFLENYPNGAVDCKHVVCICENCGALESRINMDMYIPKPGYTQPQHEKGTGAFPFEEASYVTNSDLEINYNLYRHYLHRCPKCRRKMKVLSEKEFNQKKENNEFECPNCKSKLEIAGLALWD